MSEHKCCVLNFQKINFVDCVCVFDHMDFAVLCFYFCVSTCIYLYIAYNIEYKIIFIKYVSHFDWEHFRVCWLAGIVYKPFQYFNEYNFFQDTHYTSTVYQNSCSIPIFQMAFEYCKTWGATCGATTKKNVSTFTNDSFGKINAKRAHLYIMFLLHIFLSMVAAVYSNLSYGKKKQWHYTKIFLCVCVKIYRFRKPYTFN